nr:MAG TPA: hypothetical protein [Caudoviricetes sp.]DAS56577.1 MAG TPA: hypothetical protein [Bacteriophage sp.]
MSFVTVRLEKKQLYHLCYRYGIIVFGFKISKE